MKLRAKTLIFSSLVLFASIVALNLTSRAILIRDYLTLERQSVEENLERVVDDIGDDMIALNRINFGFARWSQTARYLSDHDDTFVEENFSADAFANLHIDVLLLYDADGKLLVSRAFDLNRRVETPVPPELTRNFTADSPFLHPSSDPAHPTLSTVVLDRGPMLVSSSAIINRFYPASRGTLIVGRYLDSHVIGAISGVLNLDISTYSAADKDLPADVEAARTAMTAAQSSTLVQPVSRSQIAGYTLLRDFDGHPTVWCRILLPRVILAQGEASLNYYLGIALVNGLLFAIIALVALERSVLNRLQRLYQSVSAIRQSGDLTQRVAISGSDELSELGAAINALVAELYGAQSSLKSAFKLKSDMLANVSHDARSPLSTIQLRAEMLKQGVMGPLSEAQQRSIDTILASTHQLLLFFNNLLDASRLEAGSTPLHCRDFPLADLVQEITLLLKPEADNKGLVFQASVAEDVPPTLYGDSERLAQIVSNLAGNAIKFTDHGQVSVAFRLSGTNRLCIEVADTGSGIADEELAHIFEAFYQVEPSMTRRHMQGVGLGLTIVKQLVELMDGTVSVQSRPGVGSTFTIEIPLSQSRQVKPQ